MKELAIFVGKKLGWSLMIGMAATQLIDQIRKYANWSDNDDNKNESDEEE